MVKNNFLKNFKNHNYDYALNSKRSYFSGFNRDLFLKNPKVIAEQLSTKLIIYI